MLPRSKEIAFCTHVSDDWFYLGGADKLIKSFKFFNPDTPLYVYDSQKIQELNKKVGGKLNWLNMHPYVSRDVMEEGYRTVVHIDADSLVLGKINYDIEVISAAGPRNVLTVRNNNDKGFASKDNNPGITYRDIPVMDYKNAGLVGTNSLEFLNEWIERNETTNGVPYGEQDVLNIILSERKYLEICLDPITLYEYWGISCLDAKEDDPGYWGNMKEVEVRYARGVPEFYYNNKRIMVFHKAGGKGLPKLDLPTIFQGETLKVLQEITECY